MPKPTKKLRKPVPVRLTLDRDVGDMVIGAKKPIKVLAGVVDQKGKWQLLISGTAYDQLQTIAKPGENLSDTVKRLPAYAKPHV